MADKVTVLVCGGGNGAHTLACLASTRADVTVNVLTLYADEAERWAAKGGPLTATYMESGQTVQGQPALVSKDPSKVVPQADIIIVTVPAFAHEQYFSALAPHVNKTKCPVIVGLPSHPGFEFQAVSILKEKAKFCALVPFESLPWACRLEEFATKVQVLGTKWKLEAAFLVGSESSRKKDDIKATIQRILGEKPAIVDCHNHIACNLMAKTVIHPPIMYIKWGKQWDGKPLDKVPLFYQGVDDEQAEMLAKVSDELCKTAKAIEAKRAGVNMSSVIPVVDFYRSDPYEGRISDYSSLKSCMQTNAAFDGLVHPMKKVEGGFMPDFHQRYTCEDVPFGICVMKGIAEIAGVDTPNIDTVIEWGQGKLGKSFIVDKKLCGADVKETRAPQAYGLKTLDDLFNILE